MVEYGDQIALSFENKGCLKKVCDLNKSRTPMVAKVMVDEYTQKASESFDYDFDGENKFYPFEFPNELKNADFNILCIVGASGSGKSVFSKYFGQHNKNWVETARSGQVSPPMMLKDTRVRKERIAYSFKYIGEYDEKLNEQDVTLYCEKHKNKKTKQLSLFDM